MEGFFYWLILFAIVVLYTVVVIFIDRKILSIKDPDAILHFCEKSKSVVGNFVLLLPIDEVRKKSTITVEIQNSVQEASLEDVIDSTE